MELVCTFNWRRRHLTPITQHSDSEIYSCFMCEWLISFNCWAVFHFSSSIYGIMDFQVISSLGLLTIKLLWIFGYTSLYGYMLLFSKLVVEWLAYMVVICLRKLPNCFQKLSHFMFLHQCKRISVPSHLHQHLMSSDSINLVILTKWYLYFNVGVICISLIQKVVEHLLCIICYPLSSLLKCLSMLCLCPVLIGLFRITEFWELSVYSRYSFHIRQMSWKYFFPICGLSFHSLIVFRRAESKMAFCNLSWRW